MRQEVTGVTKRTLRRIALVVLGFTSVVPLLAWVYDLGTFKGWFWGVSVPGGVALLIVALVSAHSSGPASSLHQSLSSAAVAGVIGTLMYDIFRVPFMVLGGYRLLSPIDSYGVLLLGAESSSGLTSLAGWTYHFSNGIGFAVAYSALALRRHWLWGVAFAMLLECGTLVTPFAQDYNLSGNWPVIAIAFAAHVPYGLVLGFMLRDPSITHREMSRIYRHPGRAALGMTLAALATWLSPWSVHTPNGLMPSDNAAVQSGSMRPEFVRVNEGECFSLRNLDDVPHQVSQGLGMPVIPPGEAAEICIEGSGVIRLRITDGPYDGGFVIVED